MNVDPSSLAVVFGTVNILVTVGGGFYFMGRVTGRMDAHEDNTKRIEGDVREMKALLVSAAVDGSRLTRAEADIHNLDTDVRNLRKGIGWIRDADAPSVNREY